MLITTLDYLDDYGKPDLQAALDDAQDGDAVYMPGYLDYVAPAGGFKITKRIELRGDGPGDPTAGTGTVLKAGNPADTVLTLVGQYGAPPNVPGGLDNCHLHDFRIQGGARGLYAETFEDRKVNQLMLERIHISGTSGDGFALIGTRPPLKLDADVVEAYLLDCVAEDCGGRGLYLKFTTQAMVLHCRLKENAWAGIEAEDSGAIVTQCTLDGNDSAGISGANLILRRCALARVDACRVVNFGGSGRGCLIERCGGSGSVGNCYLELPSYGGIGIEVTSVVGDGPVLILPNRYRRVATMVKIGAVATGCVMLPQFDDTTTGPLGGIDLPVVPNAGLVAVPSVNRPSGDSTTGFVLPSRSPGGDPTLNLQGGAMAYNISTSSVRMFVGGTSPVGHDVELSPARISDLVIDLQGRHSLRLRWTSLGGSSLDLRRSEMPIITDEDFENADAVLPEPGPTPGPMGTYECFADWGEGGLGLQQCTTYYYAIKWKDGAEESPMSNMATSATLCQGFVEVECP